MPGPSERANRGKSMHLRGLQEIRPTFNEFADAGIQAERPNDADLETKIAQQTANVVFDGNRLLLQKRAVRSARRF